MSVTETGRRLLADATAMLAHAEEADRRLREDHTTLSGHLRLFATFDLGQWVVTPLVSQFLQKNPKVTATLALNNRPLQMIQEGCDVGILPGKITGQRVLPTRVSAFIDFAVHYLAPARKADQRDVGIILRYPTHHQK